MGRKTFEIEQIKNYTNGILAAECVGQRDLRMGAILVLEQVLQKSSNYRGYRYLDDKDLGENENIIPGIRPGDNQFENTDVTRRYYF